MFSFNDKRREIKGLREFLFADESMRFMMEKREEAFFCYLATHDPHKAYWAEDHFTRWNTGEREKHRCESATVRRGNFDLNHIATTTFSVVRRFNC